MPVLPTENTSGLHRGGGCYVRRNNRFLCHCWLRRTLPKPQRMLLRRLVYIWAPQGCGVVTSDVSDLTLIPAEVAASCSLHPGSIRVGVITPDVTTVLLCHRWLRRTLPRSRRRWLHHQVYIQAPQGCRLLRQAYDEQRGHTIDVLTLRPRGQSRYTKDLIRCIASGSGDEVDMFWGKRPQSRLVGTIEEEEG